MKDLEKDNAFDKAKNGGQIPHEVGGYRIGIASQSAYSLGRIVYNCVAIRFREPKTPQQ